MATTQVGFGLMGSNIPSTTLNGMDPPLTGFVSQSFTPSSSNQPTTTAVAPSPPTGMPVFAYCRIATDTAIYASFGTSPNSTSDTTRVWLPVAGVYRFQVNFGDKAAISTV